MKILKNEIRPIGFVTLEITENDVWTIIGCIEEIAYIHRRSLSEIGGTRGEIYKLLKNIVDVSK